MHILLVEPDYVLAKFYKHALERVGHSVTHVVTAQSAVSAADANMPDIVVLEMQLAGHSGAAFLYEFRTYSDWLSIPVIIHTLIPPIKMKVFEKSLEELGIAACLYKPQTSLRKLVDSVEAQVSLTM